MVSNAKKKIIYRGCGNDPDERAMRFVNSYLLGPIHSVTNLPVEYTLEISHMDANGNVCRLLQSNAVHARQPAKP